MAYRHSPADGAWSRGGAAVAVIAMVAAAAAWVVALQPVRFSTPALALAWLVAVGGVCVIARARIPGPVKAVLLAGVCGSLLTCFATQDMLGLRAVDAQTGVALPDGAAPPRPYTGVAVTSEGGEAATIAADVSEDARDSLAAADVGVSARVSAAGGGAYQLNWTLVRDGDRLWCGVITETPGRAKPPFADFGDRLAEAARRSRGGPLACER